MRNHNGCTRGFVWNKKAWYHDSCDNNEIMFGMYDTDGGTSGEMAMRWIDIGTGTPVAQLQSFSDSWHALSLFTDLLQSMKEFDYGDTSKEVSQEEFVALLFRHGFSDLTPYQQIMIKGES